MADLVKFLIKEVTSDSADNLSKDVELTQLAWRHVTVNYSIQ